MLLSNREWLYLLGLLVPLVGYNLVLKIVRVLSHAEIGGLFDAAGLVRSDVLFNLGYALLWIGLFALARGGTPGLPPIRFHDLRHTCATLLLSKDVNPKVVSEMLGHSSISVTLDIYSHLLPDSRKRPLRPWRRR